jgi:hypothetical protein
VVEACARLACETALIDGEMVVQDEHGISDFYALRSAIYTAPHRLVFFAFDLLHLDGQDLRGQPLMERRALLRRLIQRDPRCPIRAGDVCRSIHGVYLVYHDGNPERPLLIGGGNISEHLRAISCDPDLMICSVLGVLRATWAAVPEHYVEGIKNFLVYQLDPIIRSSLGSAAPFSVNLPCEKADW